MVDPYLDAQLHRLLTEDESIAEQGITVTQTPTEYVLHGQVETQARRRHIGQRAALLLSGRPVRNEITVVLARPPEGAEELP